MKLILLLLVSYYPVRAARDYLDIAQKYSPVIYQGLGTDPVADEFTRVDFDGDWDMENNWENLALFPRPSTVYWDVIESQKNYFITYAFFFPRDYASACFWVHCHENDFEGMRVTVEKPGRAIKVETLAHNFRAEVSDPPTIEVVIEKEGHGVHPRSLRHPDSPYRLYRPTDYELRPLSQLWEKRESIFREDFFVYKGKKYPARFKGKKWIIFGFGAAKPAWSWEIWRSGISKGRWFLDPADSNDPYLFNPWLD